jgi:hypothetical protein
LPAAGAAETVADAVATDCIDWGEGAALGAAATGTDWGAGAALGTDADADAEETAEVDPVVEPEAFFSGWIAPARPITPLNSPAALDASAPAALAASSGALGAAAAAPAVIAPAADAPNGVVTGFVPDGGAVTA